MIVFGIAVSNEQQLREGALPGIERVAEPNSRVITHSGFDSVQALYNRILDEAALIPYLEAVILLHQDTEIDDPLLLRKLRHALVDPSVAVVGPIGGRNVSSIAWWEGTSFGRVIAPNVRLRSRDACRWLAPAPRGAGLGLTGHRDALAAPDGAAANTMGCRVCALVSP